MRTTILPTLLLLGLAGACATPEYGQRSAAITVTTRSQVELREGLTAAGAPEPGAEQIRALGATVYVLTWREWERVEGGDLLQAVHAARRAGQDGERAAEELRAALAPYRRGEGKTPVELQVPMMVLQVVAERDGVFEAIEFNPQLHNTAVVGL